MTSVFEFFPVVKADKYETGLLQNGIIASQGHISRHPQLVFWEFFFDRLHRITNKYMVTANLGATNILLICVCSVSSYPSDSSMYVFDVPIVCIIITSASHQFAKVKYISFYIGAGKSNIHLTTDIFLKTRSILDVGSNRSIGHFEKIDKKYEMDISLESVRRFKPFFLTLLLRRGARRLQWHPTLWGWYRPVHLDRIQTQQFQIAFFYDGSFEILTTRD